jgi:hypothetical protein
MRACWGFLTTLSRRLDSLTDYVGFRAADRLPNLSLPQFFMLTRAANGFMLATVPETS